MYYSRVFSFLDLFIHAELRAGLEAACLFDKRRKECSLRVFSFDLSNLTDTDHFFSI